MYSAHHLDCIYENKYAFPVVIIMVFSIIVALLQDYCQEWLNEHEFSLYKTIDGKEELPNFFEAFTFSDAKKAIAEEANMRMNYSLTTAEPWFVNKLRKVHIPHISFTGTPWYNPLSN